MDIENIDIGKPKEYGFDKKVEAEIFKGLISVEGFDDYLNTTMSDDIKRYFNAVDDTSRNTIKGHFAFASYLKSMLEKTRSERNLTI